MENFNDKQIKDLSVKLDRVLYYLDNDPRTGRKGIYEKVEDMDKRVRDLEIINKITSAKKATLIFIGSFISGAIVWLYKIIFE